MKKIVLLVAAALMLSACSKSPEEKANVLIKEHLQKTLYHPDKYDPAETVIDSAFSPADDPEFHQKLFDAYKLSVQISEIEDQIKKAKATMSIYQNNPFGDGYIRNQYDQAKEEYESLLAQQEKLQEKGAKMKAEFDSMGKKFKKEGKKFIGFKASHKFRCQNNAGQTLFGNYYYLFDKDITQILESLDIDGDEYKTLQMMFDQIHEMAESEVEQ
ncbi:MAG: membrane lipoprotein lipid attachment site-containing protein [Bacteroidales bacterium]|nr:membrane lipoprotein lipid attachment site-containing protein [Bacteroidales bacterium]